MSSPDILLLKMKLADDIVDSVLMYCEIEDDEEFENNLYFDIINAFNKILEENQK